MFEVPPAILRVKLVIFDDSLELGMSAPVAGAPVLPAHRVGRFALT